MPTFPNSKAIASADYDPTTRRLVIQFRDGWKHYTYYNVPASVYQGLLQAPSAGRYVDTQIKPYYSVG
ncbi:KTSC domain-containing protein [Acidisoma silvae]|uniref:KTSC domain-containing protein n=1 Tax=Acidisoma silvae TaxID=2802396 RepID=A0A963YV29_9PROT|nr:KTSC domain-containing protein [Acidisoma silvae]